MARSHLTAITLPADPANALEAAPKQYVDTRGVPTGGSTGYLLTKTSGTDYADAWTDPATVSLSAFGAPTANVGWGGFVITNMGGASGGLHAMNRNSCDARYPQLNVTPTPPVFATTTARDAAITSPVVGQMCITTDTMTTWEYFTTTGWYKPLQVLSRATRTTAAGPATTEAVFLSTTGVNIPANRYLRVEAGCRGVNGPANGTGFMFIRQGTTTAGSEIYENQMTFFATGAGPAISMSNTIFYGVAQTSLQFSLSLSGSGAGASTTAGTLYPTWIHVIDAGPSS